jgi:peptidoglycan/xylan/chitin deacetylase (PgdA/CDA1 family)
MIRNFIFHRLAPVVKHSSLQMDVELFEKCIQFISSRYRVVRIEDLLHSTTLKEGGKPYASLTFDDGYIDNIEYAAPVLEKYNCKASFYVVTKCVEENIPVWGQLLEYLFLHTHVTAIDFDDDVPPNLRLTRLPAELNERLLYFRRLKAWLKKIPVTKKDIVLNLLCEQLNDVEVPQMMMNWNDLASLRNVGHYIGSHTHSHNALTLIEDETELAKELLLPRELISTNLGYKPVSIAYPFGFYNERIKKLSALVGYQMGIASDKHELYYKHRHNDFEIPRIALCNESWFKTRLRITNRIEQIKNIVPSSFLYRKNQD